VASKRSHRNQRKRNPDPVLCPACHGPGDGSPAALLTALAAILNACDTSGARLRVHCDHVVAEWPKAGGYVLADSEGRWHLGLLIRHPAATAPEPDDLDD
jgi:hypothetical protein